MADKAANLKLSRAKKSEYGEFSKYVCFESIDENGKKAEKNICVSINEEAIKKDLMFAGYHLLLTSEIQVPNQQMYTTYHNLWRIEESFKIMKSDLDALPAFLQKEETTKGHFLICYITVLL